MMGTHEPEARVTLTPHATLERALRLLRATEAPALPVVAGACLVGAVLREDLLCYAPSPASTLSIWELPGALARVRLDEEGLIRPVPHLPADASPAAALAALRDADGPVIAVDASGDWELIDWRQAWQAFCEAGPEAAPQR